MKKMQRLVTLVFFLLLVQVARSQGNIQEYLRANSFAFSLYEGFDAKTASMLRQKLSPFKLILQAEGGSHALKIYDHLPRVWLTFLNPAFGVTKYFGESGHSVSVLYNEFLRTGDTNYLVYPRRTFWKNIIAYNNTVPDERKISYYGLDFERPRTYVKALQMILPAMPPPAEINALIDLIRNADPLTEDCDYIIGINKQLKKGLEKYRSILANYLDKTFGDFERMVNNGATCKDVRNNRNPNLAANFLSFDKLFNQRMYYGELGMAHTILAKKVTAASIINNSEQFKNKVCVINLYCDNCSDQAGGPVSNSLFRDIEEDIKTYFLPISTADFTLFDLTGDDPRIAKYKAYGQFLIVAKNQN